jgi:hypothetical protein
MSLERGFRRIVAILSVGTFLVLGGVVVVSLVPAQLERERHERIHAIAAEMRKGVPGGAITAEPPTPKGRTDLDTRKPRARTQSPDAHLDAWLDDVLNREPAPLPEDPGAPLASLLAWWGAGVLIAMGGSLIPWVVFYVTRWVARGFTAPS